MKKCTSCMETKPLDEFQRRKASKDGRTARCKTCLQSYEKSRSKLPHRVKARKDYSETLDGIEIGNRAKYKYREKNPKKYAAHCAVNNAIRDGKIFKSLTCFTCNSSERLVAHHDDYDYPLIVRWLCGKCHRVWHKVNGEGLNG